MQADCPYEATDPVCLLRNEHSLLLGKLRLLEQGEKDPGAVKGLMRTIIRDSEVHFKREALLLRALAEKLESGGRSFHHLTDEHEDLERQAHYLLQNLETYSKRGARTGAVGCLIREYATLFREHIHHEETVVYILVRTRLTIQQQQHLAREILSV